MKIHFLSSVPQHMNNFLKKNFLISVPFCLWLRDEQVLEVHRTMSQVVFAADVGDLLGLHGLQLRTICDTMPQTAAERTAPLSCENTSIKCVRKGLVQCMWDETIPIRSWELTSDVQHGLVSCLEHLEDRRNLLLGFDQQSFEIHQYRLIYGERDKHFNVLPYNQRKWNVLHAV